MTDFWRDRPTLVTGATGLVGGWTVRELLRARANVICLVRDSVPHSDFVRSGIIDQVTVLHGDVRHGGVLERALGEYGIDTVLHLAAQTQVQVANRNPLSTFDTNIRGTWTILEACRRSPTVRQVVLASSDKAYGSQPQLPYDESMPLRGRHPYDVSKACADLIAQAYAATYQLPVAITRCANFYGGGDLNWNRLVPGTIRSLFRGQRPIIRSNGEQVRDYLYVEEGAAAYLLLAERLATDRALQGRAFNFSSEAPLTAREMVSRIIRLMDRDVEPEIQNIATNEIAHQTLSAARAREDLGWRMTVSLDEGLRRTIQWYRDFLQSPS